jgi:hypothetical protein
MCHYGTRERGDETIQATIIERFTKRMWQRKKCEMILDRACVMMRMDDATYLRHFASCGAGFQRQASSAAS